jgi:hypothetical protein
LPVSERQLHPCATNYETVINDMGKGMDNLLMALDTTMKRCESNLKETLRASYPYNAIYAL